MPKFWSKVINQMKLINKSNLMTNLVESRAPSEQSGPRQSKVPVANRWISQELILHEFALLCPYQFLDFLSGSLHPSQHGF